MSHMWSTHGPIVQYMHSHSSYLNILTLDYQLWQKSFINILTYTELQDTDWLCRWKAYEAALPQYTLLTPAISITLLAMEILSNVIWLLYVYAEKPPPQLAVTKLLVYSCWQHLSVHTTIIPVTFSEMLPENWADKHILLLRSSEQASVLQGYFIVCYFSQICVKE